MVFIPLTSMFIIPFNILVWDKNSPTKLLDPRCIVNELIGEPTNLILKIVYIN